MKLILPTQAGCPPGHPSPAAAHCCVAGELHGRHLPRTAAPGCASLVWFLSGSGVWGAGGGGDQARLLPARATVLGPWASCKGGEPRPAGPCCQRPAGASAGATAGPSALLPWLWRPRPPCRAVAAVPPAAAGDAVQAAPGAPGCRVHCLHPGGGTSTRAPGLTALPMHPGSRRLAARGRCARRCGCSACQQNAGCWLWTKPRQLRRCALGPCSPPDSKPARPTHTGPFSCPASAPSHSTARAPPQCAPNQCDEMERRYGLLPQMDMATMFDGFRFQVRRAARRLRQCACPAMRSGNPSKQGAHTFGRPRQAAVGRARPSHHQLCVPPPRWWWMATGRPPACCPRCAPAR